MSCGSYRLQADLMLSVLLLQRVFCTVAASAGVVTVDEGIKASFIFMTGECKVFQKCTTHAQNSVRGILKQKQFEWLTMFWLNLRRASLGPFSLGLGRMRLHLTQRQLFFPLRGFGGQIPIASQYPQTESVYSGHTWREYKLRD